MRPKEVEAGDDAAWTTTVSGIYGNSVGRADGSSPSWGAAERRRTPARRTRTPQPGIGGATNMQIAPAERTGQQ